ncbi:NUDIX hydrolase [Acrocarpospora sp. B8E8]|uniref:NUDIX hydrolase n=1 Tax=Acrocarpospora sp. B8E8 TaxID=3153572 RepID=UPI00325E5350
MSDDEYQRSLPRTPAAAALLLFDEHGRVLLVQPAYKQDGWEFPGGVVEAGETPAEAAAREVKEELGLTRPTPTRLLCVDWMRVREGEPGGPRMVFDGGLLTWEEQQAIQFPQEELRAWDLVDPADVDRFLPPERAGRFRAALEARASGAGTAYLEDGLSLT